MEVTSLGLALGVMAVFWLTILVAVLADRKTRKESLDVPQFKPYLNHRPKARS